MTRNVRLATLAAVAILFVATEVDAQGQGDSPPATPKPRAVWKTRGEVFTLAFHPDGKTLAAGIGRIDKARVLGHKALGSPWGDFPGEIEVWDVANQQFPAWVGEVP